MAIWKHNLTKQLLEVDSDNILEDLQMIANEFAIDENLKYYEPWDYLRARQLYFKKRWKEVTQEKYGKEKTKSRLES